MSAARDWVRLSATYGAAGEADAWGLVMSHYLRDELEQAAQLVQSLGVGSGAAHLDTVRMIEAEYLTRSTSKTLEMRSDLWFEFVPRELGADRPEIWSICLGEIDEVLRALGVRRSPPMLVTILARRAVTPWTPMGMGLCVHKEPYEKLCLPHEVLADDDELAAAIRHEAAHAQVAELSQGRCAPWLDEAIAMALEGGADSELREGLAEWPDSWANPEELDALFDEDAPNEETQELLLLAYEQCALIGETLVSMCGTRGLGEIASRVARGGTFDEIWRRIRGRSSEEQALRAVVGIGIDELFERARSRNEGSTRR